MSIELNFFSKLLQTNDWDSVDKAQIKPLFFVGKYKRAFRFIQDFKIKYGKVPGNDVFLRQFPDITFDSDEGLAEPMSFYCDEVRRKYKHNLIVDAIENVETDIAELDTDSAYKKLRSTLTKIENEAVITDTKKINEDTQSRWDAYEERKKSGGLTGIPTGIIPLDNMTGGLGKTDVDTILGFTGAGKSWTLVIIANNLAKEGYKVLFISREMSPDQVMKRVDAIACDISYTDFNKGQLTPQDEVKFQLYLKKIETQEDSIIVEKSTGGVSNIVALVERHSPDVVLIDGGYLMTDDSDDDDWKAVLNVWRGCKKIALEKEIPFVITAQSKDKEKMSLSKVKYSQSLVDESDQVIALEQTDEMYNDREIRLKALKLRDAERGKPFLLHWDFNKMDYSPIVIDLTDALERRAKKLEKEEPKKKKLTKVN